MTITKADVKEKSLKDLLSLEEFYVWAPGRVAIPYELLSWGEKEMWRKIWCARRLKVVKN